jgi:hypothetical protein
MTTDKSRDEICKIGLLCCDYGIIVPKKLCACAGQTMCCYSVASLPFEKDYVPSPVCSCYYLQCAPKCGCCVPPPPCPALERVRAVQSEAMDRGVGLAHPAAGTTTVEETKFADGTQVVKQSVVNADGSMTVTETKTA